MLQIRRANDRGHADHGWLNTYYTFSFASYYDPEFVGFRSLRVMNDDRIAPRQGFGAHPHRDMEIVTYVLDGALEHKDSMGNGDVLRAGEFQCMSAGSGIVHSEFNPSETETVHLYQIWLLPGERGVEPSYAQKRFDPLELANRLRVVASPTGEDDSLRIHQDAKIFLGRFEPGSEAVQMLAPSRHAWVQVLRGSLSLNGESLAAGDGAAVSDESQLLLKASESTEVLYFDLA